MSFDSFQPSAFELAFIPDRPPSFTRDPASVAGSAVALAQAARAIVIEIQKHLVVAGLGIGPTFAEAA
jgi:hypothetical protein